MSVIVPVYNVEKYIERCVRSLFSQTMAPGDLQIIFVDDCSPDRSFEIAKQVLQEFPNRKDDVKFIRTVHNSGSAIARLKGHEAATGEYEIHCDPDDWVENDIYQTLYEKAVKEDFDIVRCDIDTVEEGSNQKNNSFDNTKASSGQEMSSLILRGVQFGSMVRNLVKKDLYNEKIIWPTHSVTEDTAIMFQLYWFARKFGIVHRFLYHYCINKKSLAYTPTDASYKKQVKDQIANLDIIENFLKQQGKADCLRCQIEWRKLWIKDCAWQLVHKHSDIDIWLNIFPEINKTLFSNPYIRIPQKIHCLLIEWHVPLGFIKKSDIASRKWYKFKWHLYNVLKGKK